MLATDSGRLVVYASSFAPRENRFKSISLATERMAKLLGASVEVKTFRKRFRPIYVYYKNGDDEPIPVYCSNSDESDSKKVCSALRNMMFVLSFHPKHSALKRFRKEIMLFS